MGSQSSLVGSELPHSSSPLDEDLPSALADGFELGELSVEQRSVAASRQFDEIHHGVFASMFDAVPRSLSKSNAETAPSKAAKLPNVGDELLGLRLIRELGRGAFARVFLAHELGLAGRPVAAKISLARRDESHTLAQLQHSHIVPIYSARVDPTNGLRVLIMPYFGGTTLDRILAKAGPQAEHNPTGRGLLTALDHLSMPDDGNNRSYEPSESRQVVVPSQRSTISAINSRDLEVQSLRRRLFGRALAGMSRKQITPKENAAQPARQILEKSSYVEAVTWIAARLADGLSHAHQRGIVHRDIKPSNILIAADGQPMLLDFNLARDLKTNDASAVAYVGGTLPYMAPEHLDAFNTQNATPASAVDQRSDIYSLGILLFEMLTNERPFPVEKARSPLPVALERMAAQRRAGVPSPRELNSAVPHSLNAIVRRCLEPEPADRYQEAVSLAEDLQCELDSLPLKHTPEPSWRERVRKWMHRHPRLSSGGSIATIGILLIAVLLYLVLAIGGRLAAYDAERRWIKFQEGLIRAQLLVHTGTEPGENLEEGQRVCTQTLELFNILSDPNWFGSSRFRYLEPRVRQRLADDAVELAILLARTRAEEAKQGRTAHEQTTLISEAVELLTLAEGFTTQAVPRALFEDRSNYRLQLGDHSGAARDQERADATQVRTARDHYLRGAALAIDRQYQVAVNELKAALRADPKHFWARFQLAICYYHMGKYFDAADAYSVCEALWLECAWTNLNRGLAYSRVNMIEEAIEDYTTAIRKDPGFADAHLNRGLAYLQQQKYRECIADESLAIELGTRSSSAARSARATAYAAIGDFDAARKDYEAALNASPGDASVRRSRGFALARHDPQLALADFDALIREEPTSPHAYYGRSYVLGNMTGRIADAIDSARQAIQFDDNHVGARCALAVLLARTGAHEEATSEIERALNQNDAPAVQYAAACVYSLTACDDRTHVDRAIALLESALKGNYGHKIFSSDPDLADLRGLPKFDVLTARFGVTGQ